MRLQNLNNIAGKIRPIFVLFLFSLFLFLATFFVAAVLTGVEVSAAVEADVVGAGSSVESHAESHKVPSMNPLEVASNTAIWSLVVFLFVVAVLGKFAFKPIAKALDEREANIAETIASAQRTNDDAKKLLQQYQDKLDSARNEVRQILDAARKDAEKVAEEIVAKSREAAVQERERAMREIENATTFALQKIAERSATLATNLAGKIIRAEIKPEQHRDLIRGSLDEFVRT
ncbi:MAG: F0F1 ATP synthase subunit B [Planctomycetaceae bacterium]|jgi:F-type H+-transporting ATPase subunit b|nr:F0F1 ATP synthase subunit B [Planctomycetaceae bacterium]